MKMICFFSPSSSFAVVLQVFLFLLHLYPHGTNADITVINDIVIPEEIYDFVYSADSDVWWRGQNRTRYYCIFRSEWTPTRHPRDYPKAARFTDIAVYASTKEYRPWLINRATTIGVEKLVETGFTDTFKDEITQAGKQVLQYVEGDGFFINQENFHENYVFIPPVEVNFDYPFLNAITSMQPSPCWYTGFYLFNTVDEYDRTFWERFTLRTYPWNAGTDLGQFYTSPDADADPPLNIDRIIAANAPDSGAFLAPDGSDPLPVGEWDCQLHVCDASNPYCTKADWPPNNYCDILKYPECQSYCDPKTSEEQGLPCQECRGNGYEAKTVHFMDCCVSGHDPRHGPNCDALAAMASGAAATTTGLAATIAITLTISASAWMTQ